MKNIFKFSVFTALFVSLAAFTGCKDDSLVTDQYGDGVTFSAFAPNPVMRGGELRILGSYLEDVSEIRLQGGIAVTNYELVSKGRESEIRFIVPLEGPQPGKISIVDGKGNEFTSLAELTFTENMAIDSYSPAEALSGDVITITGEYLNIVHEVIFGGDVRVTEFESQSRHELKVVVPSAAVTGYVQIGDVNELVDENTIPNIVYSATELVIGEPAVVKAEKATYKSGDVITVAGEHLDMIQTVNLSGASDVEFTVADDAASLSFYLPASATDGNIVLVTYAGTEFIAGEIETVTVANLDVRPLAEDGRYKAGTEVEISGSDLDLVTKLEFNNAETSFYLSEGKVYATIPAEAKDGVITLTLASGKTASTAEIELVKPIITSLDADSRIAGQDELKIYGTDLDLVVFVNNGTKENEFIACEFTHTSPEELSVKIPREAYTAPFTVIAANGCESVSAVVAITYNEVVSIEFTKPSFGLGRPISITGSNLQNIESLTIKGKKVTSYTGRTDDAMSFEIPDGVGPGVYRLGVTVTSGETFNWPVPFEVTAPYTETFIWEGSEDLAGWGNSPYFGAEDAFTQAGIAEGDVIRVYFTTYADWWQFQLHDGHWGEIKLPELGGGCTVNPDYCDASVGYYAFNVTPEIISQITSVQGWGGAFLTNGEGVIITGISLIHYGATETVVWEGELYTGDDYNNNLEIGGEDDWVNAGLEEGSEIRIYFSANSETEWQIQLFDGHWNGLSELNMPGTTANQFNAENSPEAFSKGYISFKATGAIYTKLTTHAWWGSALIVQGKGVTVKKLAFI